MTLHFKTDDLRATLDPLCQRVLEQFRLPAHGLLCFFDDEDPPCFEQRFGRGYRGFHMRVGGSGHFPPYIERLFFDSRGGRAFDDVIYLRGSTCTTGTGAVITFAHELQHFMQCENAHKVSVANTLLYKHLPSFEPEKGKHPWDIPHEQDAMIVSKRVAVAVVGPDAVSIHAASRIAAEDDVLYWKYFQGLSPSASFDLLGETILLVDKYRTQLLRLKQAEVDFSKPEWWR